MTVREARRAVAIGGGTGLPLVLRCLLDLGFDTTAIVTMADDGGSSGMLRRELGMLPPGDVRNCLVAMSDPESPVAQLFQYRFPHGEGLAGHALGNLVIAALADIAGGFPEAIEAAGNLLGVRGHVYPSTLADVVLHAEDRAGRPVSGQANIAISAEPLSHVTLEPAEPPAYEPALAAIRSADAIVIGPGSLYTSLIPNFLVAGIADAVRESSATRVYLCNVANHRGETCGLDAADHVEALVSHGLAGAIDVVALHDAALAGDLSAKACGQAPEGFEPVVGGAEVRERIADLGFRVAAADLVDAEFPVRHSADRVRTLLAGLLGADLLGAVG
jgi:uncharacterized cofD-like protein